MHPASEARERGDALHNLLLFEFNFTKNLLIIPLLYLSTRRLPGPTVRAKHGEAGAGLALHDLVAHAHFKERCLRLHKQHVRPIAPRFHVIPTLTPHASVARPRNERSAAAGAVFIRFNHPHEG